MKAKTGGIQPPVFTLTPNFSLTPNVSAEVQVILTALKEYGMALADNGGALFISGVPDLRWSDDDLHELHQVKASDFEMVDVSALMGNPDSGQAHTEIFSAGFETTF